MLPLFWREEKGTKTTHFSTLNPVLSKAANGKQARPLVSEMLASTSNSRSSSCEGAFPPLPAEVPGGGILKNDTQHAGGASNSTPVASYNPRRVVDGGSR